MPGDVEMRFSMFGTPDGCDTCLQALAACPTLTIGNLWTFLCDPATNATDIVPQLVAFVEKKTTSP
jgi:hypothetical protein